MNEKNIKYILPDFLSFSRNEALINMYEKYPDIVRENTCIYSIYGTFPNAIWNGGRSVIEAEKSERRFMKKVKKFYKKHKIAITFTFTNPVLEKCHLDDKYCNEILKIFNNGLNEVLVASEILEKYIREKYPNYKINRSITSKKTNFTDMDKYYLFVIDKNLNRNFDFLNKIVNKNKIEILCDEVCINNCKYTFDHYEEFGHLQLGETAPYPLYGACRYTKRFSGSGFIANRNSTSDFYISPEDIKNIYFPMGFEYFKLSGRGRYNLIGLESIIDYCIKPEYQMYVRTYILEKMLMEYEKETNYNLRLNSNF